MDYLLETLQNFLIVNFRPGTSCLVGLRITWHLLLFLILVVESGWLEHIHYTLVIFGVALASLERNLLRMIARIAPHFGKVTLQVAQWQVRHFSL